MTNVDEALSGIELLQQMQSIDADIAAGKIRIRWENGATGTSTQVIDMPLWRDMRDDAPRIIELFNKLRSGGAIPPADFMRHDTVVDGVTTEGDASPMYPYISIRIANALGVKTFPIKTTVFTSYTFSLKNNIFTKQGDKIVIQSATGKYSYSFVIDSYNEYSLSTENGMYGICFRR